MVSGSNDMRPESASCFKAINECRVQNDLYTYKWSDTLYIIARHEVEKMRRTKVLHSKTVKIDDTSYVVVYSRLYVLLPFILCSPLLDNHVPSKLQASDPSNFQLDHIMHLTGNKQLEGERSGN